MSQGEEDVKLLGSMRSMWRVIRLLGVLLLASMQLIVRRPSTRQERAMWLHQLCRRATKTFGVEVGVRGPFPERGVLIANHLSYLDFVVFASISPCVFVSKAEVEGWPLLGWMTTMAGTVYVHRGRRGSAKEAGDGMRAVTDAGLPVVFFPEGTTSNGEAVLRFHSGLLAEALASEQPVTGAYLRYTLTRDNGSRTVRDDVAYWGEQPMPPHIFRFLGLRGVRAEVAIADSPIQFTAPSSSKLVATEARRAVCALSDERVPAEDRLEVVG